MYDLTTITRNITSDVFSQENTDTLNSILSEIETKSMALQADVSTGTGRKEITSLCYKIAQSKTFLDAAGKSLVKEWKAKSKKVDTQRKFSRDFLDELKSKIREPLTKWEINEKEKADAIIKKNQIIADHVQGLQDHELWEKERKIALKEAILKSQIAKKEKAEYEARIAKEAEETARKKVEQEIIEAKVQVELAEKNRLAEIEKLKAQAELDKQKAIQEANAEAARKEAAKQAEIKAKQDKLAVLAADKEHRRSRNLAALKCLMQFEISDVDGRKFISLVSAGKIDFMKMEY